MQLSRLDLRHISRFGAILELGSAPNNGHPSITRRAKPGQLV